MGASAVIFIGHMDRALLWWHHSMGLNYLIFVGGDSPRWSESLVITALSVFPTAVSAFTVAACVYRFSFKPYTEYGNPMSTQASTSIPTRRSRFGLALSIIRRDLYRFSVVGTVTLMLLVGGLWGASFKWSFSLRQPLFMDSIASLSMSSQRGLAHIGYWERYTEARIRMDPYPPDYGNNVRSMPNLIPSRWTGFTWHVGLESWYVSVPMWSLFVAFTIWPVITLIRWIRNRPRMGYCSGCGYDLRGSVNSKTCSECGATILGVGESRPGK